MDLCGEQWRAAMVIPIPKPNKDHTDPLSYRPIALTSCLCKVLECMINNPFVSYLEKCRILDRSQCGFRKHHSTTDHLLSLERYLLCTEAAGSWPFSLTWKRPMKQPGNMASFKTFTGLASEADCLFLCRNISGTAESESELGPYSVTNSIQRKMFQLVASLLWHALDWRSMSCHHVLPGTSSEHCSWMTWQSVFVGAPWTP